MSDFTVGKNGMPGSPPSAVRILRPGDPGFPTEAGQYDRPEQPTRTEPMADKTLCMFQGCKNPKPPGMGRRYCAEHADPETRQNAAHRPAGKKPTTTAKAIAKLRAADGPVPPAPARKASDPELYQQLTARRAQMVADIEAIDRVLAII